MELKYYTILVSPNYSNSYVLVKDWNKKNYPFGFSGVNHDGTECISAYKKEVYIKEDVDKTIAELKSEIRCKEAVEQRWFEQCMEARSEAIRLKRALWIARAERYKMIEFIAREEGNLSNQMSWSRILRDRTYNQWVDQLLRIANLANKSQNKCRAKAEEYK